MNFDFVVQLLTAEQERLEKERDLYARKKMPKGWCPSFTYEKRKPYAGAAQAKIDEIDAAIAKLTG